MKTENAIATASKSKLGTESGIGISSQGRRTGHGAAEEEEITTVVEEEGDEDQGDDSEEDEIGMWQKDDTEYGGQTPELSDEELSDA